MTRSTHHGIVYPDTAEGAAANIVDNATTAIKLLAKAPGAKWLPDPVVRGVWGLFLFGKDVPAIISYNEEGDFELLEP